MPQTNAPPVWGTPRAALSWYNLRPGTDVACIDPERPSAELFASLAKKLAPGGRLLLMLYNKYGLKYWCGARGGVDIRPFGELEGSGPMLSGAQLRRELLRAGFVSQKWYYPIPDHHYAKAVYSENKLPNSFFATVSPTQQTDGAGVLLREAAIFPGVIENGAFAFMSNSFIVEAALQKDAVMCPVDFAALTLYRQPERAFITAVNNDGTARKTAAHPKGVRSLQILSENHARLIERGINAVPITLEENSAVMPAIHHDTLWDYMQSRVVDGLFDRDEFLRIFDRLREDIIKSSALMPPGSHGWDEAFGPVQEYAYPELVPANCFYDAQRDAFIYFDQEHALQNCPFSVPLSRAIMSISYSAVLSAHEGAAELLPELIRRYGLDSCWDMLVEIERKFVAGIYNFAATGSIRAAQSAANVEIDVNRHAHDAIAGATILLRKYKSVGVYGHGKRGKRFAAALELLGAPPVFIADSKTGGLPKTAQADIIVVTPLDGAEEIAAGLREKTSIPVITLGGIFREPECV